MLTFTLAALVLIMIPGPDQALITRSALTGGRAGGLLTIVGRVLGLALHASAAALGLDARRRAARPVRPAARLCHRIHHREIGGGGLSAMAGHPDAARGRPLPPRGLRPSGDGGAKTG